MEEKSFKSRLELLIGDQSFRSFAKKCGISDSVIRAYLRGDSDPTLGKIEKIADACNISIGWLVAGEGEQTATIKQGSSEDVIDLSPLPVALRPEIRDLLTKATDIIISSTDQNRQTLTNTINIIHQSLRQEQEIADYKKKTIDQIKRLAALEKENEQLKPSKERKNVAS